MERKTLGEIIEGWGTCDPSDVIYATSFDASADARVGDRQFENGGIDDDKVFIVDGETLAHALQEWGDHGTEHFIVEDFLEELERQSS